MATAAGDPEVISAMVIELSRAVRDARAYAVAEPSPDFVCKQSFLDLIEAWSDLAVLSRKLADKPDAFEDGESRLAELHARISTCEEMIAARGLEVLGPLSG